METTVIVVLALVVLVQTIVQGMEKRVLLGQLDRLETKIMAMASQQAVATYALSSAATMPNTESETWSRSDAHEAQMAGNEFVSQILRNQE